MLGSETINEDLVLKNIKKNTLNTFKTKNLLLINIICLVIITIH